jgi:HSP20 family protein
MNDQTQLDSQDRPSGKPTQESHALRPAMDIFEDDTGITVQADMPGVSGDQLDIRMDHDTLTIEGETRLKMPEGMDALYADVRLTHYRRSFTLSQELDSEQIEASLKDGVLTLRIPKRSALQSRKIEVRVA